MRPMKEAWLGTQRKKKSKISQKKSEMQTKTTRMLIYE